MFRVSPTGTGFTGNPSVPSQFNPSIHRKNSLDARAQAVLAAVMKEHLVTGDAAGSLVSRYRLPTVRLESATIRNVMGEPRQPPS
jgi:hypothetical protein